jgi:hypothetical protein
MAQTPEALTQAHDTAATQDFAYAQQYVPEASMWHQLGVYSSMARELPRAGVHIDLGAGLMSLALASKRQNQGRTVIAVDRNACPLAVGVGVQKALRLNPLVFHHELLHQRPDGSLERLYLSRAQAERFQQNHPGSVLAVPSPEPFHGHQAREDRLIESPDAVHVVVDDIRRLELLRALLGDKEVDAVSFTNPGASDSIIEGSGLNRDVASDEVNRRIEEVTNEVRRAAFAFALERLKPGGTLLQAERLAAKGMDGRRVDAGMEAALTRALQGYLGDAAQEFDHRKTFGFRQPVGHPSEGVAWSARGAIVQSPAYLAFARWKKK